MSRFLPHLPSKALRGFCPSAIGRFLFLDRVSQLATKGGTFESAYSFSQSIVISGTDLLRQLGKRLPIAVKPITVEHETADVAVLAGLNHSLFIVPAWQTERALARELAGSCRTDWRR